MSCNNPNCESCKRVREISDDRKSQKRIKDEDKIFRNIMGEFDSDYYESL